MPSSEQVVYQQGQEILLVATTLNDKLVEEVRCQVGSTGRVQFELPDALSKISSSTFDVVHFTDPIALNQVDLGNVLCIMKPSGVVFFDHLKLVANKSESVDQTQSTLKLNGFIQVQVKASSAATVEQFKESLCGGDDVTLCRVQACKPAYEVGASVPLKLAAKTEAVKAWTLNANDMFADDIDILDSDAVLDDIDIKKPDPASLKAACAVEGAARRKACKNCSCGLAEELEAENAKVDTNAAKSSCGSCYLGDAFRCASCPYLGMPAFKPGEKIQLPAMSMQDDI